MQSWPNGAGRPAGQDVHAPVEVGGAPLPVYAQEGRALHQGTLLRARPNCRPLEEGDHSEKPTRVVCAVCVVRRRTTNVSQINQVNIDYETELNKYMEQYQEALEKLKEILKPHMGKNDPTQRGTPLMARTNHAVRSRRLLTSSFFVLRFLVHRTTEDDGSQTSAAPAEEAEEGQGKTGGRATRRQNGGGGGGGYGGRPRRRGQAARPPQAERRPQLGPVRRGLRCFIQIEMKN